MLRSEAELEITLALLYAAGRLRAQLFDNCDSFGKRLPRFLKTIKPNLRIPQIDERNVKITYASLLTRKRDSFRTHFQGFRVITLDDVNGSDVVEGDNGGSPVSCNIQSVERRAVIGQRFVITFLFGVDPANLIAHHRRAATIAKSFHLFQELLVDLEGLIQLPHRLVLDAHVVTDH